MESGIVLGTVRWQGGLLSRRQTEASRAISGQLGLQAAPYFVAISDICHWADVRGHALADGPAMHLRFVGDLLNAACCDEALADRLGRRV